MAVEGELAEATKPREASAPERGRGRAHILAAAKHLFARRGFDGVSIADIARAAGVSKSNIFHHFESKDGLYLEVIAGVVAQAPDPPPLNAEDMNIVEYFQELAAAELRGAGRDELGMRLILNEMISANPQRRRVLAQDVFAGNFARLVARIRAQQAAGRFRGEVDPALVAAVIRATTLFFILTRGVLRHLPGVRFADDPEGYAHDAMGLVLRGLLAADGKGEI